MRQSRENWTASRDVEIQTETCLSVGNEADPKRSKLVEMLLYLLRRLASTGKAEQNLGAKERAYVKQRRELALQSGHRLRRRGLKSGVESCAAIQNDEHKLGITLHEYQKDDCRGKPLRLSDGFRKSEAKWIE